MTADAPDLAALIGSRICHDLISPLGAISNGVELLALSGAAEGPEIALISESVQNATARIRFLRVAFGAAAADQVISGHELASILADLSAVARVRSDWHDVADMSRAEARLIFLLLLAAETALPAGGTVTVTPTAEGWQLTATGPRLAPDSALFGALGDVRAPGGISAAQVQFLLAPPAAAALGRRISVAHAADALTLTV